MKREDKELDRLLDQALSEIREQEADAETTARAAERVWSRVEREAAGRSEPAVEPIRDCAGFQALIPAYVTDSLTEARAMLLEDHIRGCVPCRKAVKLARSGQAASGPASVPRSARRRFQTREWSWVAAAALLIAVTLFGINIDFLGFKAGGIVTIQEVQGSAFQVSEAGIIPVSPGDRVRLDPASGDSIRTAKGSTALLELSDGSVVEMNERTQLAVHERHSRLSGERTDSTIELERGNIIIEAADQASGRLFVDTAECRAAVTGTVFSVNHGTKGSRVSVIEGEVHVRRGGGQDVLRPGDQVASNESVGRVPVEDEIAWSRNVDRHLALLNELTRMGRELDAIVATQSLRHSTELLDLAPAGTAVYVAIPNISGALGDAYLHVRNKVDTNPVLNEWWTRSVVSSGADAELDKALDKIRAFGSQLGDELVVALPVDLVGEVQEPVLLARLSGPGFRDFLAAELEQLTAATEDAPNMVILEGAVPQVTLATRPDRDESFYMWIHDGHLAAGPRLSAIETVAANVGADRANPFVGTPFHQTLAGRYRDGIEWALGVDIATLLARDTGRSPADQTSLDELGFSDVRHLVVDHRESTELSTTRATLSFDQARRGVMAWLAEPAPMGSLDFISPDASLAAAWVMKSPATLIDELFAFAASADDRQRLAEFEREQGIDVRRDLAEPIGGEFAFAFDGPMLPKPSWKLVMEVYDPIRLQRAIAWTLDRLNEGAVEANKLGFELEMTEVGGRTFHSIRSLDTDIAVHYVLVDGYLVAGPSRALLERALELRASGVTLTRSHRFTSLLPRDGEVNFSAVAYQNLGPVIGPVAHQLKQVTGTFTAEQNEMFESLARNTSASLAFAYGKRDRITLSATREGGFFSSGMGLFSLQSLFGMSQPLEHAAACQQPAQGG